MLKQHIQFVGKQLFYTLIFTGVIVLFCLLQVLLFKESFAYYWRQFHDVVLIFTFWRLTVLLAVVTLVIVIYQNKTGRNITDKINPNWFLASSFMIFLFFGCLVSQLFGGCVWLWITEGWWSRFVPSFMSDTMMNIFYIITSVLSYIFSKKLYELYLKSVVKINCIKTKNI